MKRKSIVLGGVLACMSIASQASAQQFPADDLVVTDTVLVLPAKQAQAAGFPQWREVRMTGPKGVPYRYCNWLIGAERWMEPIFGPNRWVAVKNCADGITAVTRRELQADLPYGDAVKRYWETRPKDFTFFVPDRISQSLFEALMEESVVEVDGFAFEPEQVYDDLAALGRRLDALEQFNQRLIDDGGVVTENSLQATLDTGEYVQKGDLPDTSSFVPKAEVQTMIDTAMPDVSLFVPKVEVQQMIGTAAPDTSQFLTRNQANGLYQAKGTMIPPPVTGWSLWNWLWVVLLLVALLLLGWWLWRRKKPAADTTTDMDAMNQSIETLRGETVAVKALAVKGVTLATNALEQSLPPGWELVGNVPTQVTLDKLSEGEVLVMRFVHDTQSEMAIEFTAIETAFPQNSGEHARGLSVAAAAASAKPVACRVGQVLRECRKVLEAKETAPLQPRNEKGRFIKSAEPAHPAS